MLRVAVAACLFVPVASAAAEISSDLAFACRNKATHERMLAAVLAGKGNEADTLIRAGLASGECRRMLSGDKIAIRQRDGRLACIVPAGSKPPCVWVEANDVKP